jgi:hypothetical protein
MVGQCVLAVVQTHAYNCLQKIILSGVDAYKADGPDAAITSWLSLRGILAQNWDVTALHLRADFQSFM